MPRSAAWPVKELFTVWGGNLFSKILMFLATIWLANKLEAAGFGVYSTAFAVVNYLSLALFTGLDTLVTRQSAALPEAAVWPFAKKLFSVRRRLTNFAMLVTAALAFFLGKEDASLGMALLIFGLSFLPQQIYAVNLFYGREWPGPVSIYFAGGRILYVALLFLLVKGPSDVLWAASAFGLAIAAENFYLYFTFRSRYGKLADLAVQSLALPLKSVLVLTLLTALLLLHENAPQFLVFLLKGEKEAGLYASSFRLIYTAVTFMNLGGFVFLARFSKNEKGAENAYRKARIAAMLGGVAAAVAGFFLAPYIYNALFRATYEGGAQILRAGIWQMALVPARVLAFQYLIAKGAGKKLFAPLILGVMLSLALVFYLTWQRGALGASLGLVCGELVITALLFLKAR